MHSQIIWRQVGRARARVDYKKSSATLVHSQRHSGLPHDSWRGSSLGLLGRRIRGSREFTNLPAGNDENVRGGDQPCPQGGRAGEEERQPAPVLEEEDVRPDHGQPQHLRGHAEALQGQRAEAAVHQEGGLRGAHRQVRLLHHRNHRQ